MSLQGMLGMALLCAVAALLIREAGGKMHFLLPICFGVLLLLFLFSRYGSLLTGMQDRFSAFSSLKEPMALLLKLLAVGYGVGIAADICRELGAGSIADRLELLGRFEMMLLLFPLLEEVLQLALELMA